MSDPQFLVFIGAKGGAGTTTLCRELARAMRDRGAIAVVDADFTGSRGVALLLDGVRALDSARTTSSIASAKVDGVTIVELVERYDAAYTLDAESVESYAARMDGFATIIVDAPQPFAAASRPFVQRAKRFFVVVEPTLLGVAGAHAMVADLRRFGIPANRIDVITNSRIENAAIARNEIEEALALKVVAEVSPLTQRNYAKSIATLARYIEALPKADALGALQPSASGPLAEGRSSLTGEQRGAPSGTYDPKRDAFKQEIQEALLRQADLVSASLAHTDAAKLAELRARVEAITADFVAQRKFDGSAQEMAQLRQEVLDEALGLGPLEELVNDPDVTEIMVNGPDKVYVEKRGVIEPTTKRFSGERQLRLVIERIITPLGRRIDEASPMVDARLPDGSRVNAIIEPVAIDGATLTIRRFGKRRLNAEDLVKIGAAPEQVIDFLRAAVQARLNIVVSGGTGSGKTTFLNILSSFLPDSERIITIEDAAELLLNQSHIVRLESRPPNIEGAGEIRIRDLFRNALRMRPDRIIIGECRGPEALDMLQAMNTGHDGSLTTVHANSQRDAISRIETMVLMAGFDLPVRAIREQVSSALDIVIHTARMRDGTRKLTGVSEVVGMEGDIVTMQEIVRFSQRGVDQDNRVLGEFCYTGVQPGCLKRFAEYGVPYNSRGLNELSLLSSVW